MLFTLWLLAWEIACGSYNQGIHLEYQVCDICSHSKKLHCQLSKVCLGSEPAGMPTCGWPTESWAHSPLWPALLIVTSSPLHHHTHHSPMCAMSIKYLQHLLDKRTSPVHRADKAEPSRGCITIGDTGDKHTQKQLSRDWWELQGQ